MLSHSTLKRIPDTPHAVILHEGPCEFKIGDIITSTHCRIVYDVTEFPSAVVEIPEIEIDPFSTEKISIFLTDLSYELQIGALSGNLGHRPHGYPFPYRISFTEPIGILTAQKTKSFKALIYNMGGFSSRGLPSRGQTTLSLRLDRHAINIGPLSAEYSEALPALSTPWHRPTNSLVVEIDGEGAGSSEVEELLFDLRQFLSFAWGHYIGIALAKGINDAGGATFAHWGVIQPDPVVPSFQQAHWFLPSHSEDLQQILPGCVRRFRDAQWKDPVEWALYWWLAANRPGQRSETAILASVAGLEAISSAFRKFDGTEEVHLSAPISRKRGGKGSPTARNIRGMLIKLNIPTSTLGQLDELRAIAANHNWDGPEAVTEIRNSLAHPSRGQETGVAFEASQLAMWYLEMTLLYLFDFKGQCANRTVFKKHYFARETVPWSTIRP